MSARIKGSHWRRDAYEYLADRDGEICAQCKCSSKTVWRPMGVCNNGDWEFEWECRNRMTRVYPTSNLEVDHKEPLHRGGSNDEGNLWLLCVECHKAKTIKERRARRQREEA